MKKLSPVQKLDIVLFYFRDSTNNDFEFLHKFKDEIDKRIPEHEIQLILNKLVKDGYLESKDHIYNAVANPVFGENYKTIQKYIISFEGLAFCQIVGGYQKDLDLKSSENSLAEKLTSDQMAIQTSIKRLTGWIAAGTVIAAVYYLVEVGKFLYHHVSLVHESLKFLKAYYP